MEEANEIIEIMLYKFEHISKEKNPVESLLVNGEEIELYLSGDGDEFWITNKRIMVSHHEHRKISFLFNSMIHECITFRYSTIFSISTCFITKGNDNSINIKFNNNAQLILMINKVLPITEIARVISNKILV